MYYILRCGEERLELLGEDNDISTANVRRFRLQQENSDPVVLSRSKDLVEPLQYYVLSVIDGKIQKVLHESDDLGDAETERQRIKNEFLKISHYLDIDYELCISTLRYKVIKPSLIERNELKCDCVVLQKAIDALKACYELPDIFDFKYQIQTLDAVIEKKMHRIAQLEEECN